MVNQFLYNILEKNSIIFWLFAIIGLICFILYSPRSVQRHSKSLLVLLPAILWLLVERCAEAMQASIPSPWRWIGVGICFVSVVAMIVEALKNDPGSYGIINIVGNLFMLYIIPGLLYMALGFLLLLCGGAIVLAGAVLLLAGWILLSDSYRRVDENNNIYY